jgi:hypothetical protein
MLFASITPKKIDATLVLKTRLAIKIAIMRTSWATAGKLGPIRYRHVNPRQAIIRKQEALGSRHSYCAAWEEGRC